MLGCRVSHSQHFTICTPQVELAMLLGLVRLLCIFCKLQLDPDVPLIRLGSSRVKPGHTVLKMPL